MATRKKIGWAWLIVPLIILIFVFAVTQFLNTTTTYSSYTKTYSISGWEVVRSLHHFWVWVWLGLFGCFICLGIAFLNETGIWIGRKMLGSEGISLALYILALACLISPWLRALSLKADGGVNIPKVQSYNYERTENNIVWYDRYLPAGTPDDLLPEG